MDYNAVASLRLCGEMYEAALAAVDRKRRANLSEFLREDCLRPVLEEMGMWPPEERTLTDVTGKYTFKEPTE